MAGIAARGALKVVLAGTFVLAAAAAGTALATETETADPQGAHDYYTRRAKTIIEAEKAAGPKPHPLAVSYPGMDIVVCEAGCLEQGPHVVFLRPESRGLEVASEGMMVPTSMGGEAEAALGVACIAGCYGETAAAAIPVPTTPTEQAAPAQAWSATITPRDPIDEKLSPIRR